MLIQGKRVYKKDVCPRNLRYHFIMRSVYKVLLVVAGIVSTALVIVGIFVPLLPTTPFLLLAAACFIRSSEKLYLWLITNKYLGSYIKNYREGRGISLGQKIFILSLLWITIGLSIIFATDLLIVRLLLCAIASAVTIHILRFKTLRLSKRPSNQ